MFHEKNRKLKSEPISSIKIINTGYGLMLCSEDNEKKNKVSSKSGDIETYKPSQLSLNQTDKND
jgi:hypothetical protein